MSVGRMSSGFMAIHRGRAKGEERRNGGGTKEKGRLKKGRKEEAGSLVGWHRPHKVRPMGGFHAFKLSHFHAVVLRLVSCTNMTMVLSTVLSTVRSTPPYGLQHPLAAHTFTVQRYEAYVGK